MDYKDLIDFAAFNKENDKVARELEECAKEAERDLRLLTGKFTPNDIIDDRIKEDVFPPDETETKGRY